MHVMLPGEKEAIRTVRRLGAEYGYGNLIERLCESWRQLLGLDRCPADVMPAVAAERAACLAIVVDELGEMDDPRMTRVRDAILARGK